MLDYIRKGSGSRGSALYTDENGKKPASILPDLYKCTLDDGKHANVVQEIFIKDRVCETKWRSVRPIPNEDYFYENQWRAYRNRVLQKE